MLIFLPDYLCINIRRTWYKENQKAYYQRSLGEHQIVVSLPICLEEPLYSLHIGVGLLTLS